MISLGEAANIISHAKQLDEFLFIRRMGWDGQIVPSLAVELQCQKVVVTLVLGIIEAEFLGWDFFQWVCVGF